MEAPHERIRIPSSEASPDLRGVEVTTMGRGPTDDPAFFAACFATGAAAVDVARGLSDDSVRAGAAPGSGESA